MPARHCSGGLFCFCATVGQSWQPKAPRCAAQDQGGPEATLPDRGTTGRPQTPLQFRTSCWPPSRSPHASQTRRAAGTADHLFESSPLLLAEDVRLQMIYAPRLALPLHTRRRVLRDLFSIPIPPFGLELMKPPRHLWPRTRRQVPA
jgi:hypothetical protein